ncbi:hypothetical protein [Botrimarina sp.]
MGRARSRYFAANRLVVTPGAAPVAVLLLTAAFVTGAPATTRA